MKYAKAIIILPIVQQITWNLENQGNTYAQRNVFYISAEANSEFANNKNKGRSEQ